jgi:hypothetical protein
VMVPPTSNKGHNDSNIYLCVCLSLSRSIYIYIYIYIDRPKIDLIKLENSTNLGTLKYENLKHMAFLKHVEQKIHVEAGKNEL